jgi:hypothetical protein
MQPRKEHFEFFVGVVANGDDKIIVVNDLAEGLGSVAFDAESMALGNGDGSRMNPLTGMGPSRRSWNVAQLIPDRGGELRAGRVRGAHEHYAGTIGRVGGHPAGDGGRPNRRLVKS